MKIYLAGPMRGIPDWNFPAFDAARAAWTAAGHLVFCPAAMVRALGYQNGHDHAEPDRHDGREHLKHVILSDVACLLHADAVALLLGWENSRGATVEVALAQFLGLPLFDAARPFKVGESLNGMDPSPFLDPDFCPWSEICKFLKDWAPSQETLEKWNQARKAGYAHPNNVLLTQESRSCI